MAKDNIMIFFPVVLLAPGSEKNKNSNKKTGKKTVDRENSL